MTSSWDDSISCSSGENDLTPRTVVFVRHGESAFNAEKRFSGWLDVDLTERGCQEAYLSGLRVKSAGFQFDEAHTSMLKRAVRTLWTILHVSDHHYIPIHNTWRLNERHYGALSGLSKEAAKHRFGPEMLQLYRRSFDVEPINMEVTHPLYDAIYGDGRYDHVSPALLPYGESLGMCLERVVPYWRDNILPSVKKGRRVIVAAHNNVIRSLIHHIDGVSLKDLEGLEIPTALPLVYRLDPTNGFKPMGPADARGFTGRFLDISEDIAVSDPFAHPLHDSFISADVLCLERQRLGITTYCPPVTNRFKFNSRSMMPLMPLPQLS
eukprot:CAMPEP_0185750658 /NCGR_PEP_ID=MMETSP1174-20130828/9438_1 /TAXON_ID=35687 /ORGANISM="Dictyocha speculum, Strain CCMP1381" /LENGTH=322 /DNA_ID=CAMNT_0028427293 /DNA_START=127 /DNA_END=1095 /DNA_ORIENTATION=+